jgi:hypothetical protein
MTRPSGWSKASPITSATNTSPGTSRRRCAWGPDGFLQGYPPQDIFLYALQQQKTDLSVRGYLQRYTVASAFLYWLEQRKDSRIVHELSRALEQGTYTPALFEQTCGKPLDALWDEFFAESKRAGQARTAGVPAR